MSTATITTTIEKNEVHNCRTSEISDVLGHEMCGAVHGLEKVREMVHGVSEALSDDLAARPRNMAGEALG